MLGLGLNIYKTQGFLPKYKKLVKDFKTRVLADGGIFEAEQCTINLIKSLL
jgi:hypothetical protein